MITYRMARVEDAAALAELRWDFRVEEAAGQAVHSREEFLPVCTAFFVEGIRRGDWTHWIAEAEGILIACISVLVIAKIPKPNQLQDAFGYVTNVYARPAYRNRQIGSRLMERVVAWSQEQNLQELLVWPSERSVPFITGQDLKDDEALALQLRPYIL